MTQKNILTIRETAETFGVSVQGVRKWLNQGLIRRVKHPASTQAIGILRGEVEQILTGVCGLCGKTYRKNSVKQIWCSGNCRKEASRLGVENRLPNPATLPKPSPAPDPVKQEVPGTPKPAPKPKEASKPKLSAEEREAKAMREAEAQVSKLSQEMARLRAEVLKGDQDAS